VAGPATFFQSQVAAVACASTVPKLALPLAHKRYICTRRADTEGLLSTRKLREIRGYEAARRLEPSVKQCHCRDSCHEMTSDIGHFGSPEPVNAPGCPSEACLHRHRRLKAGKQVNPVSVNGRRPSSSFIPNPEALRGFPIATSDTIYPALSSEA
jgi:hypothetical protein